MTSMSNPGDESSSSSYSTDSDYASDENEEDEEDFEEEDDVIEGLLPLVAIEAIEDGPRHLGSRGSCRTPIVAINSDRLGMSVLQDQSTPRSEYSSHAPSHMKPLVETWEKRQAQRRLGENLSSFVGSSSILLDRSVAREVGRRYGSGPDRGRLILGHNAASGTCMVSASPGRLRAVKPSNSSADPLSNEAKRLVTSVKRDERGRRLILSRLPLKQPPEHLGLLIAEMGYPAELPVKVGTSSPEPVETSQRKTAKKRKLSTLRKEFLKDHSETWNEEDDGPKPVEKVPDNRHQIALKAMFPHLDTDNLPPVIEGLKIVSHLGPVEFRVPAVLRGTTLHAKMDEIYRRLAPEEFDAGDALCAVESITIEDRRVLESTVKLIKQVNDRMWGLQIRENEGASKMRGRFQAAATSAAPAGPAYIDGTCLPFGAIDRLLELSLETTYIKPITKFSQLPIESLLMNKSIHMDSAPEGDPCHLYVLCVGVCGTSSVALPYSEAERNALWVADVLRRVGADVEVLIGCDATREAIRFTLSSLLVRARQSTSTEPKVLMYFCGRGRRGDDGDLFFVPVDAIDLMTGPNIHLFPRLINLHELSERQVFDRHIANTTGASAVHTADQPYSSRWAYPVIVTDLMFERMDVEGQPKREMKTDAENMDFWRPLYHGAIIGTQHVGGSLNIQCSFRHHSLVSYYFLKCFDGRLTNQTHHIGSMPQIVQYIASKLRKRNIPTMSLKCALVGVDTVGRVSEELVHSNQTLYTSAAAKLTMKKARLTRRCRFQIICEVDAQYRCNPIAFVTRLMARFKEVIEYNQTKGGKKAPKKEVQFSLWSGTRRMEHRVYIPETAALSLDVLRFDMLTVIGRSELNKTKAGEHAGARALETLENCRMEAAKLDHTFVIYSAGQLQNRWGKIPAANLQETEASMNFRPKEELENDFVTFLADSAYQGRDYGTLKFLFEKVFTDLITIHGCGSHEDLRKLAKMLRFGLLDVVGTCNCRIERLEIASFGALSEEEEAAIFVQRMVRRYLLARVLKSRITGALTFVRNHTAMWEKTYHAYTDELLTIFYEYQEAVFGALDRQIDRTRTQLMSDEMGAMSFIRSSVVKAWVELEGRRRSSMMVDYAATALELDKLHTTLPLYHTYQTRCLHLSQKERLVRSETQVRKKLVIDEFTASRDIKQLLEELSRYILSLKRVTPKEKAPVRVKKVPVSLEKLARM